VHAALQGTDNPYGRTTWRQILPSPATRTIPKIRTVLRIPIVRGKIRRSDSGGPLRRAFRPTVSVAAAACRQASSAHRPVRAAPCPRIQASAAAPRRADAHLETNVLTVPYSPYPPLVLIPRSLRRLLAILPLNRPPARGARSLVPEEAAWMALRTGDPIHFACLNSSASSSRYLADSSSEAFTTRLV
jgi:hypothetical protein